MKKLCFVIAVVLCMTILLSSAIAFADTADDNVLTLEEAKKIALENDVQFNLQQSYIQKASESYEDVYENNTKTARIKYSLGTITKNALSQAETAYTSSQTSYNNAFSELQNSMSKLSNNIGKNLDVFNDELDMALSVPDIKSLDLNRIKEDYMKNNSSFYSAKEDYDLAEYKLQLAEDKYDYYYDKLPNKTSTIMEQFNDMLYEAQRDFDDAKYSYSEKEKDLDLTLSSQYISINKSYESYESLLKELEDTKETVELNRIKYQMKLITKTALTSSEAELSKLESKIQTAIADLIVEYANMTQYDLE